MDPHGLTQYRVAVDIGVPPRRINEIVHGRRGITADTALRLARYFGNEPSWWMRQQSRWELEQAKERLSGELEAEVKVFDPDAPRPSRGRPPRRGSATPPEPRLSAPRVRRADPGHLFID